MVAVESAWLGALSTAGLAPVEGADLMHLVGPNDCETLAMTAEAGGNPVINLVALLRQRTVPAVAPWIHRGLTSQDVLDTSLMLAVRAVWDQLLSQLTEQISALTALARTHRATPMVARTLTQHAAPTTFGAKAAGWLNGVVDAYQRLSALIMPVQIGGAVGTWSATTELASSPARLTLRPCRERDAQRCSQVGPTSPLPWHTTRTRSPMPRMLSSNCNRLLGPHRFRRRDAGSSGNRRIERARRRKAGRSSSMPHKRNPVLSILIRRAAISTPQLAATLHIAAALANDERPDGAWHAEWDTLRTLARRTLVAGSQCAELLGGLQVHSARMEQTSRRQTFSANNAPSRPGGSGAVADLLRCRRPID